MPANTHSGTSETRMPATQQELSRALERHRAGALSEAEAAYRQILRRDPAHADALHLLGVACHQQRRPREAAAYITQAIALHNASPAYHCHLGEAERALGRLDQAIASCQRALEIDPRYTDAWFNCGLAALTARNFTLAESCFRQTLALADERPEAGATLAAQAAFHLGKTLHLQQRWAEAAAAYRDALARLPQYAEAWNNLACALHALGELRGAAEAFRQALTLQPGNVEVLLNLAAAYSLSRQFSEARHCLEKVVALAPQDHRGWLNLSNICKAQDDVREAQRAFRRASTLLPPQPLGELWTRTLCPAVFESNAEIDAYRARLQEELDRLAADPPRLTWDDIGATASCPPRNLPFQGRDDRPLLEAFASVFTPSFPVRDIPRNTGRPKVGFVVTGGHEGIFLRTWKGVFQHMQHVSFELLAAVTETSAASVQRALAGTPVSVLPLPYGFRAAAQTLQAARCDVLYHWEIGTDVTNYFLPFCRLAPVQCVGGGNAATSGVSAVDVFLSSDYQEPPAADEHYTEELWRLPALPSCQPRVALSGPPLDRIHFGVLPDQHLYVCAQKIQKIHPDFDPMLEGILQRDPRGVIVLSHDAGGRSADALRQRFQRTIPDVAGRILFQPRLPFEQYLQLLQQADVLLDPIHYGGGVTTYDGLSLNKPIVTCPTRFVRGCYTAGFYRRMGFHACVAVSPEHYVDLAVQIARDAGMRADLERELARAASVIFDDVSVARVFEQAFEQLIAKARQI